MNNKYVRSFPEQEVKYKTRQSLLKLTTENVNKANLVNVYYNMAELKTALHVSIPLIVKLVKDLEFIYKKKDIPTSVVRGERSIKYFKLEDIKNAIKVKEENQRK